MRSVSAFLPRHCWLLLVTLFFEAAGDEKLFDPDWGFESYEITIPKQLNFRKEDQGVDSSLSYLLRIGGRQHVLHLRPKKLLLPKHLPLVSFTKEGSLIEDYPYIPDECNYVGSVEGSQDVESTLSTCMGGVRAFLNIDSRSYQMEPLRTSKSFEHIVYLLREDAFSNQSCGWVDEGTDEETAQQEEMPRASNYYEPRHQKYVKLLLVFDRMRFFEVGDNESRVYDDAIFIASIMDTYYQDVRLKVHLKAVEIWTHNNMIKTAVKWLAEALTFFLIYKRDFLHFRYLSDWAHLYVARGYVDAKAWSWGRVCEEYHAGSISTLFGINVIQPATWTAHELGHGVGMRHDEEYCQCRGRTDCIMGTGRSGFSNCSYVHFFLHAAYKIAYCLSYMPDVLFKLERCGNQIVEDGEECDCGSEKECEKDLCCRPDCTLVEGVNCSTGLCCHKCDFRPSGYVCRQEENECDLAEYCDGMSALCPDDYYKQDGTPCKYEGVCFKKGCRSRYMQCQNIFGPTSREAPQQCYDAVNMIGDQYGNCGLINASKFMMCTRGTTICGRLQCINVKVLPELPDHTLIVATYLKRDNLMCWGTGYHGSMVGHAIPDIGMVADGTSCGLKQVCFNGTCTDSSSILKYDCLLGKCNNRGVCNNLKACHCMYGWTPPFCEEVGFGGSIHSGPPGPKISEEVPPSFQVVYVMLLRVFLFIISVIIVCFRQLIKK
ncbi:disintegrin and metalloproteinase domain-containing protein 30 [Psammomys obesus]|uniref:disintegrin and metalloproteinase domain-containing protein 30 n=1 Tax=Psammomys obesus TaxID=48139 RepID=UPI0024528352|nr:disintegrin and metalloproteinase domain-containing protein 30 [Psammomys obesus]